MRAGRWLVVVLASVAALIALTLSDSPVSRSIVYRPRARLESVREELALQRRALESRGYRLAREARSSAARPRVSQEVEVGECVAVVAGAEGRWRVAGVDWLGPSGRRASARHLERERVAPYRRTVLARACPMRESGWLGDRALVEMDVRLVRAGQGSADVLVFRGPPRDIADLGSPIEADRVVLEEIDRTPARFIAIAVLFAVLVIGLMVEATLHGRREQRDRERTLRRFTIALPAGLRRELEALSADATASGARALRDRLSALAPLARSAVFSRWRADPKAIDARRAALCAELTSRTGRARQSTYRAAADGLALVTILIRHRCELPELPEGLDALHLALALDSSLPRDDEELAGVDVIWHPRDPSESLDEREVAAVFPELVALDAAATARCAACEAPVAHGHASCTACGASLASG